MGQHATARAVLAEAIPRAVGPLAVPVIMGSGLGWPSARD